MDLNELREHVNSDQIEKGDHLHLLVGVFMTIALVCSLATAFVAHPVWPAIGAILFLALGVFGGRALERRHLAVEPIRSRQVAGRRA